MKRLSRIIQIAFFVLVLSAVGCGSNVAPAPNIDATVAAAVAATRTASDVDKKVKATLNEPVSDSAPGIPTAEPASNAIDEDTKAIQLAPYDAVAYAQRGVSYNELGQYQNAMNDYGNTIQFDTDYVFSPVLLC